MLLNCLEEGGEAHLVEELLEGPHLLGVDFKEAGQDWCEVFLDTCLAKLVGKCLKAKLVGKKCLKANV